MPHILLVHGAWHHGSGFDEVRAILAARGVTSLEEVMRAVSE
jgi:plasmid stability protein